MAAGTHAGTHGSPGAPPAPDMVWIPGGTFRMGSDKHYPEERPVHRVTVDGFWMDRAPVTNERFARFVDATGHTDLRRDCRRRPRTIPARCPRCCMPGSLVFVQPSGPVDVKDFTQLVAVTCAAPTGVIRTAPRAPIDGTASSIRSCT